MTDPYRLLGVPRSADDSTIRAAYLAAIRSSPPERNRDRFERVRAAYESIAHARDRLAHGLFDTSVPTAQDVLDRLRDEWKPGLPSRSTLQRLLGPS